MKTRYIEDFMKPPYFSLCDGRRFYMTWKVEFCRNLEILRKKLGLMSKRLCDIPKTVEYSENRIKETKKKPFNDLSLDKF
jgi:hypothetical protein